MNSIQETCFGADLRYAIATALLLASLAPCAAQEVTRRQMLAVQKQLMIREQRQRQADSLREVRLGTPDSAKEGGDTTQTGTDADIRAIFGDLEVCGKAVEHAIEGASIGRGRNATSSSSQRIKARVRNGNGLKCPLCGCDMSHLTVMDRCPDCGAIPEEH